MEKSVNYIVACYAGARRHYGDKTPIVELVTKQLQFLQMQPKYVEQATFVFNKSNNAEENTAIQLCVNAKCNVVIRDNQAVSYGAWQQALHAYQTCTHSFLIEDDYIPVDVNFLDYFFDMETENVKFVASLYDRGHAAIANGLIATKNVEACLKNNKQLFDLKLDNSYAGGSYYNQINFLNNMQGEIVDVTSIAYTEFLDAGRNIMQYRNNSLPLIIKPIQL